MAWSGTGKGWLATVLHPSDVSLDAASVNGSTPTIAGDPGPSRAGSFSPEVGGPQPLLLARNLRLIAVERLKGGMVC
jgi:hypothetical protein